MAERMPLSYGAADEPPAIGAARRSGGRGRPRPPRVEAGSLLFLATIGILGAAATGSLLVAGFELLLHPKPAVTEVQPARLPAPPPAAANVVKPPPPTPVAHTALVPAAPLRRTAKPPAAKLPVPGARIAMQEGDGRLAEGDVPGARFFYEQAADAGDAQAALRTGETFDRLFLTIDRLYKVRADPAAARFWYDRAQALGAVDARGRLDGLDREGRDERAAAPPRPREFSHREEFSHSERMTFREILERVLHPQPSSATLTPPKDDGP
jgi:hypothetical protein